MRSGIEVREFWDLTPRETFIAIEAAGWRAEQAARRDVALAWHVAALSRTKTLPSLKRLLQPPRARKLEGEELERRREEHRQMTENLKIGDLRIRGFGSRAGGSPAVRERAVRKVADGA